MIPEGQYGAGPVVIWDRGTFTAASGDPESELRRGKLSFTLRGRKLRGGFSLVRLKGRRSDWLLIERADEFAERGFSDFERSHSRSAEKAPRAPAAL